MTEGVSVIIPCYNSKDTIEKCILSCSKDKCCNEIIVVDDGSVDDSKNIIKKLEKKIDKIKYFYKENGGVSSARNLGLKRATSEYILFIDSDDYLSENSIDYAYEFSKRNNLDLCNFKMVKTEHLKKYNSKSGCTMYKKNEIANAMINMDIYSSCAKLIKTTIVKNKIKFNEKLSYSEDRIFIANTLKKVNNIGFSEKSLYIINNSNEISLSKKYVENIDESINKKRNALLEIFKIYPKYKENYFNIYMGLEHTFFVTYATNCFKINSPYNFTECYKIIKKKYNEFKKLDEFKSKSHEVLPKKMNEKVYYHILHTHSIFLICLFFKVKEYVKRIQFKMINKKN